MNESCKQVKKSSTDADNQSIPTENRPVQQMTPLETAERLKDIKEQMLDNISFDDAHALDYAAYYLRAIAAGEYKPVVHAHWRHYKRSYIIPYDGIDEYQCSNCGSRRSIKSKYCKDCGAVMDEEDKDAK